MERDEARSALYGLLAAPLCGPDSPWWQAVRSGEWSETLAKALGAVGMAEPAPRAGEGLEAEFRRSFVEPGHPLLPVESVYKVWTESAGADLPHARSRGWLGGDPARHMAWLYAEAGIEIPAAMAATPDHLALELEFMSLLVETGSAEQQALFRRQHLDWVGELAARANQPDVPPFYRNLLALIAAVVAHDERDGMQ